VELVDSQCWGKIQTTCYGTFGRSETYLTVHFQSGSPFLKWAGQSSRLVSRVQRHITKCSLSDSLSVSLKPVTGQLFTISLAVGTINVSYFPSLLGCLLLTGDRSGELGKRNGILQSALSIAPIFSGFLQAGIYNSLNGHAGLAGWRWLFGKFFQHWTLFSF
jgi:ACS family pantothenate transporter-like MFS transporter